MTALQTIGTAAFATALTAMVRKVWPGLDGRSVWLVALGCAVCAAVAQHYSASIPAEVWTVLDPIIAMVLASGGVDAAQNIARKTNE